MKTTLEIVCKSYGWQGGTIHDAKRHFAKLPTDRMTRTCEMLTRQVGEISDIDTACWFVEHRQHAMMLEFYAQQQQ